MTDINLEELIYDPDFTETIKVIRNSGTWVNGRFQSTPEEFDISCIVVAKSTTEMEPLPDGTWVRGQIYLYSDTKLFPTRLDDPANNSGLSSDEIEWFNQRYIISVDSNFKRNGFYAYIAQLKEVTNKQ